MRPLIYTNGLIDVLVPELDLLRIAGEVRHGGRIGLCLIPTLRRDQAGAAVGMCFEFTEWMVNHVVLGTLPVRPRTQLAAREIADALMRVDQGVEPEHQVETPDQPARPVLLDDDDHGTHVWWTPDQLRRWCLTWCAAHVDVDPCDERVGIRVRGVVAHDESMSGQLFPPLTMENVN